MIRDISATEFEALSNEGKKRYIVSLLINDSKAMPVTGDSPPIAFVMAGVPGAGKTEFLDSLTEAIDNEGRFGNFVRVDLDQIVTIYPDYTPKTYKKFRSQGNNVVARCVDEVRRRRYNVMIDGTFSGVSGSSVKNVEKLIKSGYVVVMVYMYDEAQTAWEYTRIRESLTDRGIDKNGFIESCENITENLKSVVSLFRYNKAFTLTVVKQKVLRDNNYEMLMENSDIDNIINQGYNIDKLKETL